MPAPLPSPTVRGATTLAPRGALRPLAALIVGLVVVSACSSATKPSGATPPTPTTVVASTSGSSAAPQASDATIPAPAGLPAFYTVPTPLPQGGPGTLIKSEPVPLAGVHGTVYRVMYVSTAADGHRVPVTGLVVVPQAAAPAAGYPVVTIGHGTVGMAPQCAPSLDPANGELPIPLVNTLLDKGWELTASDYQGLGTPGLLPYIVGVVAARNTIDIVRTAAHLAGAHPSSSYAVWGHSEGGQTAMYALQIGTTYAPELHLTGVVAGAAPSQFGLLYQFLRTSPFRYYLLMVAGGFNAAYGDQAAPLDQILTPLGMSLLPDLSKGCDDYLLKTIDQYPIDQITKGDPFSIPAWKALLEANDPASVTTAAAVPLLLPQGGSDEQIPPAATLLLAQHLCGLGQDLERWIYPGKDHAGVVAFYLTDMIRWLSDRFAGQPSPDPMTPTGVPGVQTMTCR